MSNTYDPNTMPTNLTEWNALIDYKLNEEAAKAEADPTYETLARADFEAMFACYYPNPVEEEPAPTFEELKAQKLAELGAAFCTACRRATVATPAGWIADADETANRNVAGLITTLEAAPKAETVQFCDHDNQFHEVTLADLKAIQLLIIEHGQKLYSLKWQYRNAIEAASDEAGLAAIAIRF